MHNESPLQTCRAEPGSADEKQPSMARLYPSDSQIHGIELQRQRAKRTEIGRAHV